MAQTRPKEVSTTIFQSLLTGSMAGMLEVLVNHPLWTIKTRKQSHLPFTLNPTLLYRGILPNAISEVPITALQLGLNRGFQKYVFHDADQLSTVQRLSAAFTAGIGSSFISCPTEMVMTYQGKIGGSFYPAAKQIVNLSSFWHLYTALPATIMREGLFTAFFLGVTTVVKAKIRPYCNQDEIAALGAGISSGVTAAVLSQGFDTVKTQQQSAELKQSLNFIKATQKIYSEYGGLGFFKGGLARGVRVVSAVTLMSYTTDTLDVAFKRYNAKNE